MSILHDRFYISFFVYYAAGYNPFNCKVEFTQTTGKVFTADKPSF